MDGNTWPSMTKAALLRGRQLLRVGGFSAAGLAVDGGGGGGDDGGAWWESGFEWFEPLLVEGTHYLRTDIAHLEGGLQHMHGLSTGQAERMRAAASFNFAARSSASVATTARRAFAVRSKFFSES